MNDGATDPQWPKLLSLTSHELRSPLTVVAGYVRMLLKESAGPLTDQQRRLLEEVEKSCGRLSGLLSELSALGHLESGTAPFNRGELDLRLLLTDAIASLPALHDRPVPISMTGGEAFDGHPARLNGDAVRLKAALASIVGAIRRELVTSDRLVVHLHRLDAAPPLLQITVGDAAGIARLLTVTPADLTTFDEWRGGNGLALATARRVIEKHGGRILSAAEHASSSAIVTLPAA